MKVNLYDNKRKKKIVGAISLASKKELPETKWNFDWKSLSIKNSQIFKLEYEEEIQGLIKITQVDEGYFEMSNLELSPENYGSKGKINNVAGCLIAYGLSLIHI